MINNGFLIKEGKIFDTKIKSYVIKKKYIGGILVFYMKTFGYKRLVDFEILLDVFPVEKVFKILRFNSKLRKDREKEIDISDSKMNYISTSDVIYNYPVKYLTKKKFNCYKVCQSLKRRSV